MTQVERAIVSKHYSFGGIARLSGGETVYFRVSQGSHVKIRDGEIVFKLADQFLKLPAEGKEIVFQRLHPLISFVYRWAPAEEYDRVQATLSQSL
jgi:hypothetical protein